MVHYSLPALHILEDAERLAKLAGSHTSDGRPGNPRQEPWSRVCAKRRDHSERPTTISRDFTIGRPRDGHPLQHARQR
jgi:hypothetical protein